MKTYTFVGDIHSAADDLRVLLADPVIQASQVIFMGDYIDGLATRRFDDHVETMSLDPLGVLAILRDRVTHHGDVALLGNHDDFWAQTAQGSDWAYQTWRLNGGAQTWRRLGIHATTLVGVAHALSTAPLVDMTAFLQQLPLTWQTPKILAVHAGIDWHRPLADQRRDDLLWIRGAYYFQDDAHRELGWHPNDLGKVIVTGHTPVQLLDHHQGYLKMQADDQDVPRYLIDAGSRSGAYDGGIFGLTLAETGQVIQKRRVIKQHLYAGDAPVTATMIATS
ncbi:metallophosphoesterase family protein [Levilactobacillus suantsaii]|uniref:Serine/threonine protein phosphatase n=1 Tax=Levilactobacillus suantsaii TaxID=2292255 RepID=A0A4Q0VMG0_9LACO|nr:metallophosphoesterase [Levilactobacillus suantsaii]RXI80028.1 serine/threonine protein phosphatase [Levilactobacillus suantsaii]